MYKKILVPLDGSPLAEAALPYAEALAKSEGAEIVVLRVPGAPAMQFLARQPALAYKTLHELNEQASTYVNAKVEGLQKDNIRATGITMDGPVPETILEVADKVDADIIAMSTHGRLGIQRILMGSVAEQIVHRAHIPVMLIHPN